MRLDQDKQIEDLAKFQREIWSDEDLTKMAVRHFHNQGFSSEEIMEDQQVGKR